MTLFDPAGEFENVDTATDFRNCFSPVMPLPRLAAANSSYAIRYDHALMEAAIEAVDRLLFQEWADAWLEDTKWHSSISAMTRHPAFAQIVGLDRTAAKLILERMAGGDVRLHWFPALRDIAGTDPVPAYERGLVPDMTQRWLEWGKAEGLIRGNA
jgi:hypothetical protein